MPTTDSDLLEAREAAGGGASKRAYVQRMFSEIAPRYDRLNHILSLNIDRRWRALAIRELAVPDDPAGTYLDLCAGTLDVSAALVRARGFTGNVIAADFAEPMLRAGRAKVPADRVRPVTSDALALPLRDGSISGALVAFGIRNLANLSDGLREVARVLRPGARFVILEFSTPDRALMRAMYGFYFRRVLPVIGGAVSGHPTAYRYLPESVAAFPDREALADRMRGAGFDDVRWSALTFGIAALHVARRATDPARSSGSHASRTLARA